MSYLLFAPFQRELSYLVLDTQELRPSAPALVDAPMTALLELGGNVVDCAYIYRGGESKRMPGQMNVTSGNERLRARKARSGRSRSRCWIAAQACR